jgi:hypothetical protein
MSSLSIKTMLDWLAATCVPLALTLGGGVAVWKGLSDPVEAGPQVQSVPFFEFSSPEIAPYQTIAKAGTGVSDREPFRTTTPGPVQQETEEVIDLQEVRLGMIAMTDGVRICLTNGRLMLAGQQDARFSIGTITEQGVWYVTGKEQFFLTVGDKVSLGRDGTVHRLSQKTTADDKDV